MTNQPRQIVKNTAALAASRLLEKASGVCLSFLVARYLGAAALGIYSAAMVSFGLISLMAGAGCATFLVREISRDRSRTSSYLIHVGFMSVLAALGLVAGAWLLVPHLGYSPELQASVFAVVFASAPGALKPIQEAAFVAHQRTEFITYSSLAAALINVSATVYLLRHGYTIVSLVLAFAILQYFIGSSYLFLFNQYVSRLQWSLSVRFAAQLLRDIRVFAGSSVLAALFARPEVLILSLFKNDAQIGFYSAALRIVDLWQLIPETFMTNVLPILSRFEHAADRLQSELMLEKSIKYLLAISLPLMAGIFAAARPIVELFYGPGFEPAVLILRILACSIPLIFLFEVLWRLLAARNQQHLMLRAQVITILVRLAGGYACIAWLGSFGAAMTATLILLEHDLLLGYYVRRGGVRLGIFRLAWRLSLAALGTGLLTGVLADRWPLWALVPLSAFLYAALVVLMKALAADDFALFRKTRTTGSEAADRVEFSHDVEGRATEPVRN